MCRGYEPFLLQQVGEEGSFSLRFCLIETLRQGLQLQQKSAELKGEVERNVALEDRVARMV